MSTDVAACPLCAARRASRHLVISPDIQIVRCARCSLLYRSPQSQDLAALYDERYFRRDYETHADGSGRDYVADRERLLRSFDEHIADLERWCRPGRLLDVGCAAGFLLEAARRRGWEVMGLDVSAYAVAYARTTLQLTVQQGSVEAAHFPAQSFDAITAFEYIEHIPNPIRALTQLRRWLRDGGHLALTTPNADAWAARRHPQQFAAFLEPRHLTYFTPRTMQRVLQHTGFHVRALRTDSPIVSIARLRAAGLSPTGGQRLRATVNRYVPWLKTELRRIVGRVIQGGSLKVYATTERSSGVR